MGWYEEFQKVLSTAGQQLKGQHLPKPQDIHFTTKFYAKATAWRLSEKDARDVFFHGIQVKPNMRARKYNGYEIGIWYFTDHLTGQAIITSIWKRGRR